MESEFARVQEMSAWFRETWGAPPSAVVVLGSGLSDAAWLDGEVVSSAAFSDVPGFPVSTVAGHRGRLAVGSVGGVRTLLCFGRVHLYEGYSAVEVVRFVRAAALWGVSVAVFTNAAGSLRPDLAPGTLMGITDHVNLTGTNPLVGPNWDALGPRFPDMHKAYDPELRGALAAAAGALDIRWSTGVYAGLLGPSYETPAEVEMLRRLGADAVGMSTVLEVIAAVHAGMRVAGISCIANAASRADGPPLRHEEVTAVMARSGRDLAAVVARALPAMAGGEGSA